MTNRDIQRLLKELSSLTGGTLDLRLRMLHDDEASLVSQALRESQDVTALDISDNSLTCEGLKVICEAIAAKPSVVSLIASGNDLDNRALEVAAEAVVSKGTVQVLDFSRNRIGDAGVVKLAAAIRKNPSVRQVTLNNNVIGPLGAQCLLESMIDSGMVSELDLSYNRIGDKDKEDFAKLLNDQNADAEVRESSLDWTYALGRVLAKSTLLHSINLRANYIFNIDGLVRGIGDSKCLRSLDLSQNLLDDRAFEKLALALKANRSITRLNLSHQKSKLSSGIVALAQALETNVCLSHLQLRGDFVSNEGLVAISRMLVANKSMSSVDLSYNKLDPLTRSMFARAVAVNRGINQLTFHGMDKFAVERLSEAIRGNRFVCQVTINTLQDPLLKRAREKIELVTGTNSQTFSKAVKFATLQTLDKSLADAFETFSNNKAFRDQLQEATGADPKCLISVKRHFIASNFFKITKVIRHKLVCDSAPLQCNGPCPMQLDSVNEYCLSFICSFLKVADVQPSKVVAAAKAETSTHPFWKAMGEMVKY